MVCGVTCHRAQRQQHFVATQLHKSYAPLVRAVEPTEHELSHESPQTLSGVLKGHHSLNTWGDSGRGYPVISKYVVALMVACRDVCEEIRVRDDAVQPEGLLMRDVADFIGW